MQEYIFSHLATLKVAGIIVASAIAGEVSGVLEETSKHPALVSGLVGGGVALAIKLLDVWYENRKNQRESKLKSVASADKVLEIETQEKRELREEMRRLRAEEKQLAMEQLMIAKAEAFEARARAHRYSNEVMKLQSLILGLQNQMASASPPIPIPPITFTPYYELMFGTPKDQEELAHQQQAMRDRMTAEDEAVHKSSQG